MACGWSPAGEYLETTSNLATQSLLLGKYW